MWQICQKRQFIPLLIEEGDFLPQDVKISIWDVLLIKHQTHDNVKLMLL